MHLYIKSDLPPNSTPQRHFDLIKFFDQSKDLIKFLIGRDDDCQIKIADNCLAENKSRGGRENERPTDSGVGLFHKNHPEEWN